MEFDSCPSLAPFLGYMGVAASIIFASELKALEKHFDSPLLFLRASFILLLFTHLLSCPPYCVFQMLVLHMELLKLALE